MLVASSVALLAAVTTAACAGPQSALDPAGPAASSIHRLGIWMWIGTAVVVLLVTVLALLPFIRPGARRPRRALFLWGGGVALAAITLTVLVPFVFTVGHDMRAPTSGITISVTGFLYWWDVEYRVDPAGSSRLTTANELRIPVGEPVELLLRSNDVIHSFWVPSLAGKTDMIPGRVTRMVIRADRPGVFRGQCAEFCGAQHSLMAFEVTAVARPEFDAWLQRLRSAVRDPLTDELRQGRDLFQSLGCGVCHTVRGISVSRRGPDLTLVGARRTIGAGTLPGGIGNIAGWIASAQHLKPGNAMPSYDRLQGPELRALAAWLESLK